MAFDPIAFRKRLPEFKDTAKYTDDMIILWGDFATCMVNVKYWKSQTQKGIDLYTAHEITLEAQSQAAANIGGTPGQQSGPVNTKTVGSVTVGYDSTQAAEKDAGWWNLTSYGKQFYRLSRTFGAGCAQL